MRMCLITNPGSGTAEQGAMLAEAAPALGAEVWQTEQPGDATAFAERAARAGVPLVVACGGDGTVNEVTNGLLRVPADARPRFGIVPLGTGNDLARTLALPTDAAEALALLGTGATVALDAFRVTGAGADRYGLNVAAGGFSAVVNEQMDLDEGLKKRWGPLAYLIGAVRALPSLEAFQVDLALDDAPPMALDVFNVFVANARFVAGGKRVAPFADPADGWLDVVVVQSAGAAEMARLAARYAAGQHHDDVLVATFRARRVAVQSTPPLRFNVDGELLTDEPEGFEVLPGALQTVVGPGYVSAEQPFPESTDAGTLPPPPLPAL